VTDRPNAPNQQPPTDGADDSRAEQVLAQALRAMAGGGKAPGTAAAGSPVRQRRLTTGQLVLLAAIVGLLIGIGAGFISLMLS
jgi:hypothetical protein